MEIIIAEKNVEIKKLKEKYRELRKSYKKFDKILKEKNSIIIQREEEIEKIVELF